MPLLSPSGGLVYHARALRDAKVRWRPFREAIGAWLEAWAPPCDRLLIVGPSGGYSLRTDWLARFRGIVAIDFDPLAQRIFQRRHRGCRVDRWIVEDVFPLGSQGLDLSPLRRRLDEYSNHAVLFSNVLGQIATSAARDDRLETGLAELRPLLKGRTWASYHDRLAAAQFPALPIDRRHRTDLQLAHEAYPGGEISSYATGLFGRGLECTLFSWECERGYWNLIEACRG